MIRYGIVGVGGFAARWVKALAEVEETGVARLAAAVVRNPARYAPQVAALQARGCTIHASLEEMLAQARNTIDIAGVPTGISQHVPMATQAMEAGYNVLIEKPVAATIQDVCRLREAEVRTGRWCAVAYQWIYSPTIQWLKDRLKSGRLGALREARTAIGWPRDGSYYARNPWAGQLVYEGHWVLDGPATNATAHYLTNLLYLAGAQDEPGGRIASVRAELYRARAIAGYDTSCIEVRTAGRARLLHYASHALDEALEPLMDISCEGGSIHWEAADNSAVIRYADGSVERFAGDPGGLHVGLFTQVARVAGGEDPAPLCGVAEGEPQVLAVDLAFESSGGIVPIAGQYTRRHAAGGGSEIICVDGMRGLLEAGLARGLMYSELGAPWARRTLPVRAEGYVRFPQAESLRLALGRPAGSGCGES